MRRSQQLLSLLLYRLFFVQAIFFFIEYLVLRFQLTWVLIGKTSLLGLEILLGLVGMAITSQVFADIRAINYFVGFWQNIPATKEQDIKNFITQQQPVQYNALSNLSFQQNEQGIQFTAQQLSSYNDLQSSYLFIQFKCLRCNIYFYQRTQKIQAISVAIVSCVIQIALLAFYASEKSRSEIWGLGCLEYCSGFGLQMVEAIFFLIGFIVVIVLQFVKLSFLKWILLGNIIFMGLGLLLGLIGMAITAELYKPETTSSSYQPYNYVVAFWFIEIGMLVIALMYEYILYRESQVTNQVQTLNNTMTQQVETQPVNVHPK